MYPIYQFKDNADPASLSRFLWQQKIPHRINSSTEGHQLWLANMADKDLVLVIISAWENGTDLAEITSQHGQQAAIKKPKPVAIKQYLKAFPATVCLILLAALLALWTQLGKDLSIVAYFSISPFEVYGNQVRFMPLEEVLAQAQYWRLFTPALLHFSVLHLVFNLLWVWDIGRKLEHLLGSLVWIFGVLIIALASNVLQYQINTNPLFGGLSGVVYGLIGFAWLTPMLIKSWPPVISRQLMMFFVVFLAIGYTDIPQLIGLGNIANTAHSIGLAAGLALSIVYFLVTRLLGRK